MNLYTSGNGLSRKQNKHNSLKGEGNEVSYFDPRSFYIEFDTGMG